MPPMPPKLKTPKARRAYGPWGRSMFRAARSNFEVLEMHSMQYLRVPTFVCLAVTCLRTMKLQGGMRGESGIETYRFTREALQ